MIRYGKKKNVAVTAVARELACFIWGMMTDHISIARYQAAIRPSRVNELLRSPCQLAVILMDDSQAD